MSPSRTWQTTGNAAAASDVLAHRDELRGRRGQGRQARCDDRSKARARAMRSRAGRRCSPTTLGTSRSSTIARMRWRACAKTMDALGDKAGAKAIAHAAGEAARRRRRGSADAARRDDVQLAARRGLRPISASPLELVPALEKSAKRFAEGVRPTGAPRVAVLEGRRNPADAATWADKALALAYGPRKARLLGSCAATSPPRPATRRPRSTFREQAVKQYESPAERRRQPRCARGGQSGPRGDRNRQRGLARLRRTGRVRQVECGRVGREVEHRNRAAAAIAVAHEADARLHARVLDLGKLSTVNWPSRTAPGSTRSPRPRTRTSDRAPAPRRRSPSRSADHSPSS